MSSRNIVIVGAGVIGLQTAITLLEAGYAVSVVAQFFPGDENALYTSPWAGANWRTHAPKSDTEQCGWDAETYRYWKDLVAAEQKSGKTGQSGISMMPGRHYWDAVFEEVEHGLQSVWWTSVVDNVEEIPKADLPEGSIFGMTYTTFTVDVPKYLKYLVQRVEELGGRLHRAVLPTDKGLERALETAGKEANITGPFIAVNATGIAAKQLVGDDQLDVIQGQTVLVKGEAHEQAARIGKEILDVCVIIPRLGSGTTVIGSSRDPGNWNVQIRDEVTQDLLRKGKVLAPELLNEHGEFEVIAPTAGLRPYRKGGARVDFERLPNGQAVIHEYGHGGAGYQNSIGSANKVLRLLREDSS